jgi:hypothetical protein
MRLRGGRICGGTLKCGKWERKRMRRGKCEEEMEVKERRGKIRDGKRPSK